jgi:hypothetical protein
MDFFKAPADGGDLLRGEVEENVFGGVREKLLASFGWSVSRVNPWLRRNPGLWAANKSAGFPNKSSSFNGDTSPSEEEDSSSFMSG